MARVTKKQFSVFKQFERCIVSCT